MPLTNTFNMVCKRTVDIVGAVVAIILFSPVMLVTAILVKTTSKGPLIYKQERVGLHNQTFQMYKFRSMEVQSEKSEKKAWTVRNDPRVTAVGKVIRRTSIDELPQLFNILKGDMSLVGTRPPTVDEWDKYDLHHRARLATKPGITGMWQVSGRSNITDFEDVVKLDRQYIAEWNFALDIKILFKTVLVVFKRDGAI